MESLSPRLGLRRLLLFAPVSLVLLLLVLRSSLVILRRRYEECVEARGLRTPWPQAPTQRMPYDQVSDLFFDAVELLDGRCRPALRVGRPGDGGWDVCLARPFFPRRPCLVYSFGVNFVWEFDDDMSAFLGCEVHAFDPSMRLGDHRRPSGVVFHNLGLSAGERKKGGWKMATLRQIRSQLGHLWRPIDYLKADVEYHEWGVFERALSDGVLRDVKQLSLEIHTSEVPPIRRLTTKKEYARFFALLQRLHEAGFRKWRVHKNENLQPYRAVRNMSKVNSRLRSCCYELYYFNSRFNHDCT